MDCKALSEFKGIPITQAQELLDEVKAADRAVMELHQLPIEKLTREIWLHHNRSYARARAAHKNAFDLNS